MCSVEVQVKPFSFFTEETRDLVDTHTHVSALTCISFAYYVNTRMKIVLQI